MAFTLMTMGANLILLWVFSRAKEGAQRFLQPLAVFGRAPLFFLRKVRMIERSI
jgi:hypothetical protein